MITYWVVNTAEGWDCVIREDESPRGGARPWQGHYVYNLATIPPLRGRPGGLAA